MTILKIAVTGSIGSGKSLVCRRLGELGCQTLDCDVIARQVVEPGQEGFKQVVERFGPQVVGEDGSLDRAGLRQLIVRDDSLRRELESILHPQILSRLMFEMENARFEDQDFKAVAVEVPLLFETGMEKYFDCSIAVVADPEVIVTRIQGRDKVAAADARKMLALQMAQDEKIKRADHVVQNSAGTLELIETVDDLFAKIKKEFLTI